MWVVSLLYTTQVGALLVCMALVVCNTLLIAYVFSKIGVTNLPSAFVAGSYLLMMSSVPLLHTSWRGQVCVLGILVMALLLGHMEHREERVEESFLCTLIIGLLCYVYPLSLALLPLLWLVLLMRRMFTLRVLLSSLIGIMLVVLYGGLVWYMGWLDVPWMEIISHWADVSIAMTIGLMGVIVLVLYVAIRQESVWSGVLYSVCLVLLLLLGIGLHVQGLI